MGILASVLFWFLSITTCLSGFGFLFKFPHLYHPDAYMVNGEPGTGDTDFEKIATYVFACVYLAPIGGVIYAYVAHGGAVSEGMMAACISPMLYHAMSVVGVYAVFGQYLNPAMTTIHSAAAMHAVYAILFGLLYCTAKSSAAKVIAANKSK